MSVRFQIVLFGLIIVAAALAADRALAQTSAITNGNWSDGATWDNGEPNTSLSAFINGGFTVTIDQASESTNLIDLGTAAGETGNLNITGGDLTVSHASDPGAFPSSIRIAQADGSTGNLTMTGGTVNINGNVGSPFAVADLMVGDVGNGTMTLSGGTFSVADEVFVGLVGPSNSSLNVSGGTLHINGRNLLLSFFGGATGNLNLSGTGTINVADFLFSSFNDGATSTINQSGGTLNIGVAFVQGRRGNSTFDHTGGEVQVTTARGNGDFVVGDGGPNNVYNISGTASVDAGRNFMVGAFGDAHGVVNQSGGTIDIGNFLRVGIDGVGEWNQTGGTVNVAGSAWLGDFDTSLGTYKISGGLLNVTNDLSVGAALASNAPAMPTGTEGQALDADGTLIVSGSGGAIHIDRNLLANPGDHTRRRDDGTGDNVSMLVFEVLDNSGVSTIDVAGFADLTGTIIDVNILGGSFGFGSTFDLISASDISDDFVQAPADLGRIELAVIAGGNGEILRATLVPEPAPIALAGLALLGVGAGRAARRKLDRR